MATQKDELTLYSENLPRMKGWGSFTDAEKEQIQQITSDANKGYRHTNHSAIATTVILANAQAWCNARPEADFEDWLETNWEGSPSQAKRQLEWLEANSGFAPPKALLYLADKGLAGQGKAHLGTLSTVLKALPAPKDPKKWDGWVEDVGVRIKKSYSDRGKGKRTTSISEEHAMQVGVASVNRVIREAKLPDTNAERAFLKRLGGYVMQLRAIPRSVTFERTPLPDGLLPKRGAPRGPRKKKTK